MISVNHLKAGKKLIDALEGMALAAIVNERSSQPAIEIALDDL